MGERSAERGAAMVAVALALTAFLLCAGLALDLGRARLLQAQLQTAVDAGALAGALQVPPATAEALAREALLRNATWPGGSHGARLEGVAAAADPTRGTVTVTATLRVPTHFLRLIGVREMRLTRTGAAAPVRRAERSGGELAERRGSKLME